MSGGRDRGALAIVLHTHMPYVEGFGTWPFGEEWLWEAIVGSYLPLLELLDAGAPLTLSLTPVLCDQLEVAGLAERFAAFVRRGPRRDPRARTRAGLREGGHERLARELERSLGGLRAGAASGLRERGGDLLGAFARHAQWTSSATHAVLPLLASDRRRARCRCAPAWRPTGAASARTGAGASGCRSAPTPPGSSARSRTRA